MKALLAAAVAVLLAAPAYADTCNTTVQGYLNWVGAPPASTQRSLVLTLTTLDASSKATYTSASLSSYRAAGCGKVGLFYTCWPQSVSTPAVTQVFGNWSCVSESNPFPYCLNPFNEGPDQATVSLSMPSALGGAGGIVYTAHTSGITSESIPLANLTCSNGVMYGFGTNTASPLFSVSVRENQVAIPK